MSNEEIYEHLQKILQLLREHDCRQGDSAADGAEEEIVELLKNLERLQ